MTTEQRAVIDEVLDALADGDAEGVLEVYTDDIAGIDEVSREWMRGREELSTYTQSMLEGISDLRSELSDVHETVIGDDAAVVTCMLSQDYVWEGEPQHVEMPTTFVLRRDTDRWRICLFHSAPLPG